MDVSSLLNVSTGAVSTVTEKLTTAKGNEEANGGDMFEAIFNSAVDNIRTTNGYIAETDNEKIKLAMGETENTHDLTIAMQKSSTALAYTVAVRDKFIEAYKEIMQMQI